MKKALQKTAKTSAKSVSAATSPPRPGMTQKRSFHGTPQDAAYSRSALGSSQTPQYSQYQQPPRPQAQTQASYESKMSYSSASGDAVRRGSAHSADGIAYDEDMIEELRPIFAEKARRSGGSGGAGTTQMRAMNTGKGDEWVW